MKHILITNDDGYEAEGLLALIDALKPIAKVTENRCRKIGVRVCQEGVTTNVN